MSYTLTTIWFILVKNSNNFNPKSISFYSLITFSWNLNIKLRISYKKNDVAVIISRYNWFEHHKYPQDQKLYHILSFISLSEFYEGNNQSKFYYNSCLSSHNQIRSLLIIIFTMRHILTPRIYKHNNSISLYIRLIFKYFIKLWTFWEREKKNERSKKIFISATPLRSFFPFFRTWLIYESQLRWKALLTLTLIFSLFYFHIIYFYFTFKRIVIFGVMSLLKAVWMNCEKPMG